MFTRKPLNFFLVPFIFERERERERERDNENECQRGRGRDRGRETQNLKQAPGSKLPAQSLTPGSNPRTMRP